MSQRLFKAGKIGCFIDSYGPGVEKRRGEEVSVLSVRFRVQPFDAKLAHALDDGVGDDSNIRATVFTMSSGDPKPNFTRHDFKLGLARQNLELFASPDTAEARVALLQAKISGTYVRSQKDMNALALIFKATFGPVGREELELIHSLHRLQTFVTFQEAEPLLDTENDEEELTDADEKAQDVVNGRPAPMWEDEASAKSAKPAKERAHRKLHSHAAGRKKTARRHAR